MKTMKYILLVCLVLSLVCGYSQTPPLRLTKKEAISRIKESYHYKYFRNPTDTLANLNNFIETVNKIVPMSDQKKNMLKEQAMSAIHAQIDKLSLTYQMNDLVFTQAKHIFLMGTNVIDIVHDNFSEEEFLRIYETMDQDRKWDIYAYGVLKAIRKREHKEVTSKDKAMMSPEERVERIKNLPSNKETLDSVFDEFNID
jgi:hypothetical protein